METHKIISASEARELAMKPTNEDMRNKAFDKLVETCGTYIRSGAEKGFVSCMLDINYRIIGKGFDDRDYTWLLVQIRKFLETNGYHVENPEEGYTIKISWEYS